jgi:hypothetical protein
VGVRPGRRLALRGEELLAELGQHLRADLLAELGQLLLLLVLDVVAGARGQVGERVLELRFTRLVAGEHDQQVLEPLVLLLGVLLHLRHPVLVPHRVEHRLLGERVQCQLEADLVDHDPAVAAAALEVLELSLHDGVVVGDEVVDVAGPGRVGQGHGASRRTVGGPATPTRGPHEHVARRSFVAGLVAALRGRYA